MKQYLLSVHMVEGQEPPSPEAMQQTYQDVDALNAAAAGRGRLGVRRWPAPARPRRRSCGSSDGEVLTTDGPFAETKEQLGGFWVIQAADLDAALAWAAKATKACGGPVEVRPFQEEPEG